MCFILDMASWDHLKEPELKEKRQQSSSSPKCLCCRKEKASYICRDCNKFLCGDCETKHHKIKTFKTHVILELCHQHLEGISHVCMQCVQALCIKCIVLDYEDHKHQVEEYNEGMEKLKSEFEMINSKLKEKTTKVDRYQQEIEIQIKNAKKDEESMKKKRAALMEQIGKIDSQSEGCRENI